MKSALLALLLFSCQAQPWSTGAPEDTGFDAEAIATLVEELRRGEHGVVDHFVLIRNGVKVVDERFTPSHDKVLMDQSESAPPAMYDYANQDWHPYKDGTRLHTMQSVTKSVTSIAIGLAIAEGKIPGVDAKVLPYLADYIVNPDPRWAELRLADLLTMRSGIEWSLPTGTSDYSSSHPTLLMENSDAWLPFIVQRPMSSQPGTTFQYVDGASVLLGEIVKQATGERVDDYLRERLFEPLGVDDFYWKITPAGEADTEGGLYLTADGLARIGWLFLQDGRWEGEQLVPAEWVAESIAPHVTQVGQDPGSGYGYQWWVTRHADGETQLFSARGYGGQFILASRATGTLCVFLGWDRPAHTPELFETRILGALR